MRFLISRPGEAMGPWNSTNREVVLKLNLILFENILREIEKSPEPELRLSALLGALEIGAADETALRMLKRHIEILGSESIVECDDQVCFGFGLGAREELTWWDVSYSLSLAGYQILEGLQNKTLWNSVAAGASEIGIEDLRQIPGTVLRTLWLAVERTSVRDDAKTTA